jgi:ubiquinone/menaquinone biosynthesis C-methylase UbiE
MDPQALESLDSSVDAVLSRFGVMLAPEPARVVREARRVLRDGGDPIGPSGVFSLAAPDTNREILNAAGFTDIRVDEIPCPLP